MYKNGDVVVFFSSGEEYQKAKNYDEISEESVDFLLSFGGDVVKIEDISMVHEGKSSGFLIRLDNIGILFNPDYIKGYAEDTAEVISFSGPIRTTEKVKQSLGLIRLKNWETNKANERTLDILQAMLRYSQEEKPIPREWVKELTGRVINLMGDE